MYNLNGIKSKIKTYICLLLFRWYLNELLLGVLSTVFFYWDVEFFEDKIVEMVISMEYNLKKELFADILMNYIVSMLLLYQVLILLINTFTN